MERSRTSLISASKWLLDSVIFARQSSTFSGCPSFMRASSCLLYTSGLAHVEHLLDVTARHSALQLTDEARGALAGIGKLHLRQAQFLAALPNSLAQIFGIADFPSWVARLSLAKRYLRIRMHHLPISYYFSDKGYYSTKWEDFSV